MVLSFAVHAWSVATKTFPLLKGESGRAANARAMSDLLPRESRDSGAAPQSGRDVRVPGTFRGEHYELGAV
jgi:hypothetical protein